MRHVLVFSRIRAELTYLIVFAIGNSMADLVANITVAQFAPAMAYAACFVSLLKSDIVDEAD